MTDESKRACGILLLATNCQVIICFEEILRSESRKQVMQALTDLYTITPMLTRIVIYDAGCLLAKSVRANFADESRSNEFNNNIGFKALKEVRFFVDRFHLSNHKDKYCHTHLNLDLDDTLKNINSSSCEQINSWIKSYSQMLSNMNEYRFVAALLILFHLLPNNLNIVNEQYKVTTHQLSEDLSIKIPSNSEITISGFTLKWPTFEVKNVMYTGQAYTLYNTCAIDSALFSLYFIYVTDEIISSELKEAAESSPYATLIKTFNIVEKEGWDVARIYCSTDENIDKFEIETEGVCPIMMKRKEEISEAEALQKKYRDGRVPFFNCETNKNEYERGWICNSTNIHTSATFDYGHPPITIVNIKLFSKRIDEGYEPNPVRLRDLKDTIRICSIKYKLRAVINHRDAHFTATLIGPDKELYIYDDRQGARRTRTSPDRVEIAVYTQIYEY
ncbi:unnamed protein product [Rotaria socialis]|uniref:Uncharacterized protein n=3 Tax=Rotaria socialis TaxID=392032 RepID=A0A817S974_9BILA|nr:unnamed protein product [Rotaria socialis]